MKKGTKPLLRVTPIISNHKTTFRSLNKEIVIEAPGGLVRQLIKLCNGSQTIEEIIKILKKDWDEELLKEFLTELIQREVLIDACCVSEEVWKAVSNPMLFPVHLSEEEVAKLVQLATERHHSNTEVNYLYPKQSPIEKIIRKRRSVRVFSGKLITLQSLIGMLWSAYGEFTDKENRSHRTIPSAGALYPIIIHLVLFNKTNDLDKGVYRAHYNQDGGVGLQLVSKDVLRCTRSFLSPVKVLRGAHGVIVISGSFLITGEKYGNRSILYVPLEAGHAAQNIILEAASKNVATVEIGGFVDDLLREAVNLPDGYKPLTTIVFGKEEANLKTENLDLVPEVDWAVPVFEEYRLPFAMASARISTKRSWSHGRDSSPNIALIKAISETKEWMSCGCIPQLTKARIDELESAIDPRSIIRFHPAQYRMKGFPFTPFDIRKKYEWTKGYDAVTRSDVNILADLVYFPYFPETPYYAYANSSGCAAYPDEQVAIEKGTLELVERDSFMNSYLSKLVHPTIAFETFPEEIQKRIRGLESLGFKVWVKDHSLDLAPVVFVFAQNDKLAFTTCASCSSFDVAYSLSHALMEVEASIVSRIQNGTPVTIKPYEVEMPLDHGRLYGQKQYYQQANFLIDGGELIPFEKIGEKVARTWNELIDRFIQKGWQLLIVPLNLSEEYGGNGTLHIVRCIVPGMVPMTFGYRQEPANMERIYMIAKEFGGQVISYKELTKFPHPFE